MPLLYQYKLIPTFDNELQTTDFDILYRRHNLSFKNLFFIKQKQILTKQVFTYIQKTETSSMLKLQA